MAAASVLQIKNYIFREAKALGNSDREEKHVCSDLLNNYIHTDKDLADVCEGTFLCSQTIHRMMELKESVGGNPYNPGSDTCARILRFFNVEVTYKAGSKIKEKYQNKPKPSAA